MITAAVSAISLDPGPASRAGVCAFSSFDELGCLPNELEEVAGHPGWHILGNGLPALVAHRVTELDLEQNLWDMEDWTWVAVFVPLEPANRAQEGRCVDPGAHDANLELRGGGEDDCRAGR